MIVPPTDMSFSNSSFQGKKGEQARLALSVQAYLEIHI